METRCATRGLAALAGGLLAVPILGWAQTSWGPGGVPAALDECEAELEACLAMPCSIFPGDGWNNPDYPPGGAPLSFTIIGDGTFTDDNTGLMWEMKDSQDDVVDYDNPHDADNTYTWGTYDLPDGTAFTEFLDTLNLSEFAGHSDWRLPTVKELQSLLDFSDHLSAGGALPGETQRDEYWSSTTYATLQNIAWTVHFRYGIAHFESVDDSYNYKYIAHYVRAVRGGQ